MTEKGFKKMVLYVDPSLRSLKTRRSPLTYPIWGDDVRQTTAYKNSLKKHQHNTVYYTFSDSPDDCECHFWPLNYWATKSKGQLSAFESALKTARAHKKKLLVDAFGDTMDVVPYDDVIVLRIAQYRRRMKECDIITPVYTEDLLETYCGGVPSRRGKKDTPTVGFVGWARLPFWKHLRSYIKETPIFLWSLISPRDGVFRKGVFLRAQALSVLSRSSRVETNFLIRKSYSGNERTAEKNTEELRREFVDNIDHADYTLCQKGDANQSTRFFETLSMGRIPLVVDTECVFPLEDQISYKDFCIFVDNTDIKKTADILADRHARITMEQFENMQRKARETYEKYLRIDSFTPFLTEEIRKRL